MTSPPSRAAGSAGLYVGLMSGTSLDGIDAVLVELEGEQPDALHCRTLAFASRPYTTGERQRLLDLLERGTPADLCRLHADVGEAFAESALQVLRLAGTDPAEVVAIGSHGQTVWHEPPEGSRRGATLQLGDPATIAERTGIDVVSDLRSRDVAAGGHGAPLVCFADRILFPTEREGKAIQNLGGMGNVAWLPGSESADRDLLAFDTGPANALIDLAVEMATGGAQTFDRGGALAARGHVLGELLERCLAHPFFAQSPPRSTGREEFGRPYLEGVLEDRTPVDEQGWCDVIATLTAVTARSIGDAYRAWVLPRGMDEVVLVGGGAHNSALKAMIQEEMGEVPVRTAAELGVDADAREAVGFAILAWAHEHGVPGNEVGATGAQGPRILGSRTPGRRS